MNNKKSVLSSSSASIKSHLDWQLVTFGLVILLLVNLNQWQRWTQSLDFSLYDNHIRTLSTFADEEIIIVEIDEQSISLLGSWPWPRSYHGQMIDLLTQANADVIAYNVIFSNADMLNENDQALARSIEKSGRTILPLYFDRLLKKDNVSEVLPAESFRQYAALGHVNSYLDNDGTLRSIRLIDPFLDRQWPHFAFVSYLYDRPDLDLNGYGFEEAYIPFVNRNDFKRVSFVDVLMGLIPAETLSERVVFIGVTATSVGDPLLTPVDDGGRQSPAVDINANVYQALKHNQLIQPVPDLIGILINSCLIIGLLCLLPRLSGLQQFLVILVSGVCLWFVSYALITQGYWYRIAGLMLAFVIIPFIWNLLRLSRLFSYFRQQIKELKQQQVKEAFNLPGRSLLKNDMELAALLNLMQIEKYSLFAPGITDLESTLSVIKYVPVNIEQQEKNLAVYFDQYTALEHRKVSLLSQLLNAEGESGSIVMNNNPLVMGVFANQLSLINTFQQQLAMTHSLFEVSIQGISAGILVSDLTGKVLFSNQALSVLTTENISEVKDLLPSLKLFNKDWLTVLREVILLQQPLTLEASGNDKDLSISVRCIDSQQGMAPLLVFNITDISEIKQAHRSRNEMIDFLSHDLRSPMASLQALVQQVRGSSDLEASVNLEIIDKVDQYSQRGLDFSEQFLHLAKVETEELIQHYEIDLYSISQNALDSLYHQAQKKLINLSLSVVDDCWVMANGDLLERVILNLVSNAIKYSPSGSEVSISISQKKTVDSHKLLEVRITDQGPGIPTELLNSLFKPYQRGSDSNTQKAQGIGLGLRFVDVALKRLGSQINFDSSAKGASFYFTLESISI